MNLRNGNGNVVTVTTRVRHFPGDSGGSRILLATVASDAHTWNLAYLQLLLAELGHEVINLGGCTPADLVVEFCGRSAPDLVVVSTINGHGAVDGVELMRRLTRDPRARLVPAVIGGKLDIGYGRGSARGKLLAAGYRAVYEDTDPDSPREFLVGVLEDVRTRAIAQPHGVA